MRVPEWWRLPETLAGSTSRTSSTLSGREEEVCSGIAQAAFAIGRWACQSPGAEPEKRKRESQAIAWKGGGGKLSPARARGRGGWDGRPIGRAGLLWILATSPNHPSSDSGWHCASQRAGEAPEEKLRLSPES